ncbi:MAG: hypothetical protein ACYTHM_24080, partial [Planctomycetota bacterium]
MSNPTPALVLFFSLLWSTLPALAGDSGVKRKVSEKEICNLYKYIPQESLVVSPDGKRFASLYSRDNKVSIFVDGLREKTAYEAI